ncbi:VPS41, partial [Symbiodinium sp. CCMP2456]
VRWRASLIAWGNEKGVKVYNTATSQKVTYVPRPPGGGRVTGLLWISDDQLAMSWSSVVKLAVILPAEGSNLYAQVRHDLPSPDV